VGNCKRKFKNLIITHSRRISNNHRQTLKDLENRLAFLQRQSFIGDDKIQCEFIRVKLEIQDLINKKLEGAKIRAKALELDNQEQPTAYYTRREKTHAAKSTIKELLINGQLVSCTADIVSECQSFYQRIFTAEHIDDNAVNYFLDGLPKLSTTQADVCDGPISYGECLLAIRGMKNGKSPGSDGLGKEFYDKFFYLFGNDFVSVINRAYTDGALSESQRTGYITLLCKNPACPENLSNWRPISLLNVDYKIISKSLANRLRKVLPAVVNIDQTCSVPGRSIMDNLHLLRNVVDYCEYKQSRCAIISFDQAKAFDRVSHDFIFRVLRAFGFGESFIRWIFVLYFDTRSRILVNGFLSDLVYIGRSVRQGCGLSPLLYVLTIEPLAHKIRLDSNIHGLRLPGGADELRISLYADDATTFILDEMSAERVIELFVAFGSASGSLLNKAKTQGMWVGLGPQGAPPIPGILLTDSLKICGVFFGREAGALNENFMLDKMRKAVAASLSRNLTLRGKVALFNIVILARLWYTGSCLALSKTFVEAAERISFQYLWKTVEYVGRKTVLLPRLEGGLGLIHIPSRLASLRVMHLKRFLVGDNIKWHSFARYWAALSLRHFRADLWSNLEPHSVWQPTYYHRALRDVRLLQSITQQFNFSTVTLKFVYTHLAAGHCVRPRIENIRPTVDFRLTWKAIDNSFLSPKARDVAWRVAHNVLPVLSFLNYIQVTYVRNCPFCATDIETVEHLILKCPVVLPVWYLVESWIRRLPVTNFQLTLETILYFNLPVCPSSVNTMLIILFSELAFTIWTKRNEVVYDKKRRTTRDIETLFLYRLHTRIKADFYRLPRPIFVDLWTQGSALASVVTDRLLINV
jgi:hypothetical protein